MSRVTLWSLAIVAVGFCHGCSSGDDSTLEDVDHDVVPINGLTSGANCPTDSRLTYVDFGRQFVATYCLHCHTRQQTGAERLSPPDRNFDDLASIRSMAYAIDRQAAAGPNGVNRTMPPEAPMPSLDQREQLGEWLACGARMGVGVADESGSGSAPDPP